MRFLFFTIIALTTTSFFQVVAAQDVYVDNVVIVLDGSGSMQGSMNGMHASKMQAAKTAISEVMKTIPQSTHIGLIAFGGNLNRWVYPLGPRNDKAFFDSLSRINPSGGTPLGEYMKYGADALLKAREIQYGYGSYRLLIVTDGEASDGTLVNRFTPDIISRGITVDVIGVDMQNDHMLATRANSYRRANDPASLKTAIQEVFAEVENKADTGNEESDFSKLKNIPDEIILEIIKAMAVSGNHPISLKSSMGNPSPQTQHPASNSVSNSNNSRKNHKWIFVMAIFIVLILVLKVAQS